MSRVGREKGKKLLTGKVPYELLKQVIGKVYQADDRVVVGPAPGIDAAVIRPGDRYIVVTSDPITLASELSSYYCVHVNANDIAVMGGKPEFMNVVLLLPVGATDLVVESIAKDLARYTRSIDVNIIGGHMEVTDAVKEPVLIATMIGTVKRGKVISSANAKVGDVVVMTKFAGIEGSAIIAREKKNRLKRAGISDRVIERVGNWLFRPGISVLRESQLAVSVGCSAMHDVTEGGVITALWEFANASGLRLEVSLDKIRVHRWTKEFCKVFGIDPLKLISSGSLLVGISSSKVDVLMKRFKECRIPSAIVGEFKKGSSGAIDVSTGRVLEPCVDDIVKIYE